MHCPHCQSTRIRRAARHGLHEGLWLRIIHRAPYRCRDCRERFIGPWHHHHAAAHPGRTTGLTAYLGLDDADGGVTLTLTVVTLMLLAALIVLGGLILFSDAPSAPHGGLAQPVRQFAARTTGHSLAEVARVPQITAKSEALSAGWPLAGPKVATST